MNNTTVLLNNTNIDKYVTEIPAISQNAGDVGGLIINDISSLTGISINGFWDQHSPRSPFFGAMNLKNFGVKILQDGETIFEGFVLRIILDITSKTATVQVQSNLDALTKNKLIFVDENINVTDTDIEVIGTTPPKLVANICDYYKIPYDQPSFSAADALYELDLVRFSLISPLPESTIISILQEIADAAVARIYSLNGVLYFYPWNPVESLPVYIFSDRYDAPLTILEAPVIETIEKEEILGWRVTYGQEQAHSVGSEDQQTKSVDGTGLLKIVNSQSAVWVGDRWYKYANYPEQRVTLKISKRFGLFLKIGFTIGVEIHGRETILIDIIGIDDNNELYTEITGVG